MPCRFASSGTVATSRSASRAILALNVASNFLRDLVISVLRRLRQSRTLHTLTFGPISGVHFIEANTPFEKLPGTQINVPRLNLHKRPRHRRCPTSRDFVPWRFSDAGRRSAWIASSCRHPKTYTRADLALFAAGRGNAIARFGQTYCLVTNPNLMEG